MIKIQNIEPGTILKVYCPSKLVWHYGVMSHFGMVIDRAKRGVRLRSWAEFSENLPVKIVPSDVADFPKEVIHERAMGLVGQRGYHMIFQNCEHFVTWCRKNKISSPQLNNAIFCFLLLALVISLIRLFRSK